jgi:hypothetical protein
VPLTYEQFRYAFANAVEEDEAKSLYDVLRARVGRADLPGGRGQPQPWTEVKVKSKNPDRGPLLIISGEQDHTVPPAIASTRSRSGTRA